MPKILKATLLKKIQSRIPSFSNEHEVNGTIWSSNSEYSRCFWFCGLRTIHTLFIGLYNRQNQSKTTERTNLSKKKNLKQMKNPKPENKICCNYYSICSGDGLHYFAHGRSRGACLNDRIRLCNQQSRVKEANLITTSLQIGRNLTKTDRFETSLESWQIEEVKLLHVWNLWKKSNFPTLNINECLTGN